MLKRKLFLMLILLFVYGSTLWAAVPPMMNFQGILTNASGSPLVSTSRTVQFTIYDAAVAGAVQWAETLTVNTDASGRFNTILGQVHPLADAVFSGTDRYLGLTVASDPELTPRSRIVSVGYANRVSTVDGATGGIITGDVTLNSTLTADNVVAGDATTAGTLSIQQGNGVAGVYSTGNWLGVGFGGSLDLRNQGGYQHIRLEPDGNGSSGWFSIQDPGTGSFFYVDGNSGTGSPAVSAFGSGSSFSFYTYTSGDAAVLLTPDAISAPEILDEPGIAANYNGAPLPLSNASMTDIVTVTINLPAAGYIVLNGRTDVIISGTTLYQYGVIQIDQTAGGSATSPYASYTGACDFASADCKYFPSSVTRTYYFGTSGSHTFRLEGTAYSGNGTVMVWNSFLTATYYPTSYGSVITVASQGEASQFEQATAIQASKVTGTLEMGGPAQAGTSEIMYQVDLRELELKVAKTRAEAEKAQRELLQAQMKLQQEKIQTLNPKPERK